MNMRHTIVQLSFFIVLGVVVLIPFRTIYAAEVFLTTANASPKINERFIVTVNLRGNDQTLGTDVILRYDPTYLVVQDVSEGTLYPTYNPAGAARVNKDAGLVVLSGSTGFGQVIPANGVFSTVSFVALKEGKTAITLEYEQGMTNKTGVISPMGEELLTSAPTPLSITVKRQSLFGGLLSFFQSLWKK